MKPQLRWDSLVLGGVWAIDVGWTEGGDPSVLVVPTDHSDGARLVAKAWAEQIVDMFEFHSTEGRK